MVYQTCSEASGGFKIPAKQSSPFAWEYPSLSRDVFVEFHRGNELNYHSSANKYNFDTINKILESTLPISEQEEITIQTTTEIHGKTRILRFYSSTEEKKTTTKEEIAELSFQLKLTGIGISLISTTEEKRIEILYLNIKGIEAALLNTNLSQAYQFRVKYTICDNNSHLESPFPVLLAPLNSQELLDPDSSNYFIDILIQRDVESLGVTNINIF